MVFQKGNKIRKGKKLTDEHKMKIREKLKKRKITWRDKIIKSRLKNKKITNWKGGKTKINGYIQIMTNKGYILEHHLVWMKHNQLHRIPDGCVIHHLNGIRDDNRTENLQLMDKKTHTVLHNKLRGFFEVS